MPKIRYLIIVGFIFILIFKGGYLKNKILSYKYRIVLKYYKLVVGRDNSAKTEYSGIELIKNVTFNNPVTLKGSSLFPNHLFLAQQNGVLKKIDTVSGVTEVMLDISDKTLSTSPAGFYNFDFHPKDSVMAIAYTSLDTRGKSLQNFELIPVKNKKLVFVSRKKLYKLPSDVHFGGGLEFDSTGNLFISTGDRSFGDEENYTQSLSSLYGKILRVKIDNLTVSIPTDNPFYNVRNARKEIWAYGLRNPFRLALIESGNKIVVGDVGHEKMEEVDVIEKGKNYGWSIKEGTLEFKKIASKSALSPPIYEYEHGLEGFSVTGGIVYKGTKFPELRDKYIFGDYILGNIWMLDWTASKPIPKLILKGATGVTSFYETANGDILWTDFVKSKIFKLTKINENVSAR